MMPLIGITCSRAVGGSWGLYAAGHFMDYAFDDYSQAIRFWGGAPVLIPVAQGRETLQAILRRLDGLILSGGPDVNPKFYGEQPLPGLEEIDEDLDRMELEAARMAFESNLPILAICRGIQVLNVSQGGTLYQDIPTQVRESILHTQKADKKTTTHATRIEPKTLLSRIVGRKEIWVNGKHHQAVKDVARGFVVSGRATDDVVEAMEHPSRRFVIGVQWHPEGNWKGDLYSRRLFRAFVRAAQRR